eukprot:scaffold86391_cov52-Attheya_sp.AAC.4
MEMQGAVGMQMLLLQLSPLANVGMANLTLSCRIVVEGRGKSCQNLGLCHVTHGGFLDTLESNFPTIPEGSSSSKPGSKGQQSLLLDREKDATKVWVELAHAYIGLSPSPTGELGRSVHRCICNRFPRSIEITFDSRSGIGVTICQ